MSEFEIPNPAGVESEEELIAKEEQERFGDRLRDEKVAGRVVRGSSVRVIGYGIGSAAIALSSIFMLRYLGVADFGRYAVVMSLIMIVMGVTDAGLTTVGNRELALRESTAERKDLLAQLFGMRLIVTPLGVLAAVVFAVLAGYDKLLVQGTAIAGIGLTLIAASSAYSLALVVDLKIARLTVLEVIKQVVPTIMIVLLIVASASLLPFFAVGIPGAILALALTPRLAGRDSIAAPSFAVKRWLPLLRMAVPVAISTTIAVIYIRVLTLLMYELSNDFETGLFSTSVRVIEIVLGIPWMVFAVVLPVLSVANSEDRARTLYIFQRMMEVGLIFSVLVAILLCFASEPIIDILGGPEYAGAIPVLQIQAFMLIAAFITQGYMYATVALDKMRELIIANVLGLVAIVAIGIPLIDSWDAQGAAAAAVLADSVLAVVYIVLIGRGESGLKLNFMPIWKPILAGLLAVAAALAIGAPPILQTAIAAAVFVIATLVTRAIPSEVYDAFRRRATGG